MTKLWRHSVIDMFCRSNITVAVTARCTVVTRSLQSQSHHSHNCEQLLKSGLSLRFRELAYIRFRRWISAYFTTIGQILDVSGRPLRHMHEFWRTHLCCTIMRVVCTIGVECFHSSDDSSICINDTCNNRQLNTYISKLGFHLTYWKMPTEFTEAFFSTYAYACLQNFFGSSIRPTVDLWPYVAILRRTIRHKRGYVH